ncbi:hypothetical protein LSM04_008954 [Trypanosoma melophagium]|uniref:uncharacterized protein n=1 Tax=Trypanosoma melophagium TaxID=715481 RepID=UPI00351AB021|nr:hypothetical protein LSM04_000423 [Trypanosoma melophagium]KAH9601358.1 hypothetical protein LSM04_000443 [Trypanosoma melophagium]KAH9601362.1 hypothetical protein LSM04_000523 [Trypanosoma melophagium]KAH9601389.1 hypothetical protein LSM04_001061 [Trypanosoma melophagium]KAH9601410.1 hypothetical protein LSM04_001380 [Trypanosoma melophagium]
MVAPHPPATQPQKQGMYAVSVHRAVLAMFFCALLCLQLAAAQQYAAEGSADPPGPDGASAAAFPWVAAGAVLAAAAFALP